MPLQKQSIPINFKKGLDLKTDPFQLSPDNFLNLTNSVFTTTGRLTKRNGYTNTPFQNTTLSASVNTLTTFNGNLTATGQYLFAFSEDTDQWLSKGNIHPIQLNTQPIVRMNTAQSAPDAAIANGMVCTSYSDSGQAYYVITDVTTGQQLISRQQLSTNALYPRAFVLGNYFIVTFLNSAGTTIDGVGIPLNNIENPTGILSIATGVSGVTAGYDGVIANDFLFLAYSGTSTTIKLAYINSSLNSSAVVDIPSQSADLMSLSNDVGKSRLFLNWWNGTNIYSAAFDYTLTQRMAVTEIAASVDIAEITAYSNNGTSTVFYENINNYGYDSSIRTDYISSNTVSLPSSGTGTGTIGTPGIVIRSLGLASKAYSNDGVIYMLAAYDSPEQSSYFLIDSSGNCYMRLAYSNGGGYVASQVLPNVSYYDSSYYIPYLLNDFLVSVNKGLNLSTSPVSAQTPASSIFTQQGVSLAQIGMSTSQQHSSEISGTLNLTGGLLWEYDGVKPVENNFNYWPDSVEISVGGSFIGTLNNTTTISSVTSFSNLEVGMPIAGIGIPASTTIVSLDPGASTMTISNAATSAGLSLIAYGYLTAGETYFYQFTYEWTNNQGNIERSAPSIPVSQTILTAPSSFTANTNNNNTLTSVSSLSGLQVGQLMNYGTGSGLTGAVWIIAIDTTANTVTLSQNSSTSNSGIDFYPITIMSNTLNVPTDRVTYKVTPNPIRIVGYRWGSDQQIYYQFTNLFNPTLNSTTVDYESIIDTNADAQILGNPIIYTNGGVVEDIAAPASIDSALFDTRLWLVDAEDQNLMWFSKQCIEDVPVEMSDLLTFYVAPSTSAQGSTGYITAIYPMDDKLIIFKKDAAYYINGTGPDNTGSNSQYSQPIFITSAVGCDNPDSIVLTPQGLMFQSDKGIWLLGRDLSTNYIGASVEVYNNITVLSATAIPATTQVRFILEGGTTLMYDYFFNEWGTHTNVSAISSTLYQNLHTYLNSYGQVYQENPGNYLDGTEPVLMSLTTAWINLSGLQGFERFYFANLVGTYFSPFILDVSFAYNYNPSPVQTIQVRPDNYTVPWGDEAFWGSGGAWGSDDDPGYASAANVFTARMFPEIQKCQSFQLNIQEVFDPTIGASPGEGLTLSGLLLTIGSKRGYRTQSAKRSFG